MTTTKPVQSEITARPPQGFREVLLANTRPQPAIPAVFVCLMFVIAPLMLQGWQLSDSGFMPWAVAAGIVCSCALAIAAGFCSLFPQVAWLALVGFVLARSDFALLPNLHQVLLVAGSALVVAMVFYQIWRVRTGKFLPTITA